MNVLLKVYLYLYFVFLWQDVIAARKNTGNNLTGYELLYEETISPNKEYGEQDKDAVYYTVNVYRNSNNNIIVNATSNSVFLMSLITNINIMKNY